MWRKTFLDDEIKAQSVHNLDLGSFLSPEAIVGGVGGFLVGGPAGAAIGAGLGASGSAAAEGSAEAASAATAQNIEFQKWLWGEQQAQMAPFLSAGGAGMDAYMQALGFTYQPGTPGTEGTASTQTMGTQPSTYSQLPQTAGMQPLQSGTISSSMTSHEAQAALAENRRIAASNQALSSQSVSQPAASKTGLNVYGYTPEGMKLMMDEGSIGSADWMNATAAARQAEASSPAGLAGSPKYYYDNEYGPAARGQTQTQGQGTPGTPGTPGRWVGPDNPLQDEEFSFRDFNYGVSDLEMDPSYEFRKKEGISGLQDSALGGAGLLRGDTMKGIMQYGQDLASTEYGKAYDRSYQRYTGDYARGFQQYQAKFDRRQQLLNNLFQLAQTGANTAVGAQSSGNVLSQQMGQSYSDLANIGAARESASFNNMTSMAGLGLQAYDVFK